MQSFTFPRMGDVEQPFALHDPTRCFAMYLTTNSDRNDGCSASISNRRELMPWIASATHSFLLYRHRRAQFWSIVNHILIDINLRQGTSHSYHLWTMIFAALSVAKIVNSSLSGRCFYRVLCYTGSANAGRRVVQASSYEYYFFHRPRVATLQRLTPQHPAMAAMKKGKVPRS